MPTELMCWFQIVVKLSSHNREVDENVASANVGTWSVRRKNDTAVDYEVAIH
jgi:hypothetical protein